VLEQTLHRGYAALILQLWCLTRSGKAGKAGHHNCKINTTAGVRYPRRERLPFQTIHRMVNNGAQSAASQDHENCVLTMREALALCIPGADLRRAPAYLEWRSSAEGGVA
jgi:hypothetical protein